MSDFELEPSARAPAWLAPVRQALARAPDPAQARALAQEVLAAAPRAELETLAAAAPERLGEVLLALCGVAPFLASYLVRRPGWLLALLRDPLDAPRSPEAQRAELDAELAAEPSDAFQTLRRFKYRELARITVRDCSERLVPLARSDVTLQELSQLADLLLQRALQVARTRLAARFGPPRWRDVTGADVELAFTVLGLGKLGAEELNYSSDVDLVYVFEAPAHELAESPKGPSHAALPAAEYFTRLAQQFGKLVGDVSDEGFLYRIDLDLRPQGGQGTLVVSDEALAVYYESWADAWEKATFMKARPVAGDLGFGWRAVRAVDPMIYRSVMDLAAVEGIRELKAKIAAAHGGRQPGFNVKLGAGGIRDFEFVAQALQLLHGGRIEQIRARGTRDALERLRDVQLLSAEQSAGLLDAYLFLRRLEHRLQMSAEGQTHTLPEDERERTRMARALGYLGPDATAQLEHTLRRHCETVSRAVAEAFPERDTDRVFALLSGHAPELLAAESSRVALEDLAERFTRAVAASADPERAFNNLDHFVRGLGRRRFYFELLSDRPELVPRLTALFAASSYLSAMLASHPVLIEPVFHDPNVLLLDRDGLERDFEQILAECLQRRDERSEAALDALRRFYHRQIINAGLLDLGGKVSRTELALALTEIAEVCLCRALAQSREWLQERRPKLAAAAAGTRFIVVGMGKLASRELSYGSDLDLIFVFDPGSPDADPNDAQEYCTRLSQRLISMLQTSTEEGACYEVDPRLRPSGNQGALVASIEGFARYHGREAAVWERVALLRARAVAGDLELRARFERLRSEVLLQPLPQDALAEITHVRDRMEKELAKEGERRHDFKRGPGGLLDVETIVQYLQLRHGTQHAELLEVAPIEELLQRLARLGLLPAAQAETLRRGWEMLQRLANRLRVVENRSVSDLDEERGDIEALARTLGYPSQGPPGSARRALLRDYRHHTRAIRAAYDALRAASDQPAAGES